MITQEQLDADLANVATAQKVYEADKAAYDLLQPHLSVLAEIEAYAEHISAEAKDSFLGAVAKARALF
jgi:hypothetical protein